MDKQHGKRVAKTGRRPENKKHTSIHLEQHSTEYQIGKLQAMVACMDSGFKNSPPSMTDWPLKWIDA